MNLRRLALLGAPCAIVLAVVLYRWGANSSPEPRRAGETSQSGPAQAASQSVSAGRASRGPVPVVTKPAQVQDFPIRRRTIGSMESPATVTVRARLESQVLEQH